MNGAAEAPAHRPDHTSAEHNEANVRDAAHPDDADKKHSKCRSEYQVATSHGDGATERIQRLRQCDSRNSPSCVCCQGHRDKQQQQACLAKAQQNGQYEKTHAEPRHADARANKKTLQSGNQRRVTRASVA